jgi:hypothetical protein
MWLRRAPNDDTHGVIGAPRRQEGRTCGRSTSGSSSWCWPARCRAPAPRAGRPTRAVCTTRSVSRRTHSSSPRGATYRDALIINAREATVRVEADEVTFDNVRIENWNCAGRTQRRPRRRHRVPLLLGAHGDRLGHPDDASLRQPVVVHDTRRIHHGHRPGSARYAERDLRRVSNTASVTTPARRRVNRVRVLGESAAPS